VEMSRVALESTMPLLQRNYNNSFMPNPPHLTNVETIKSIGTTPLPLPHQWQNCSPDSLVASPAGVLNDGISYHGHYNYNKHGDHD